MSKIFQIHSNNSIIQCSFNENFKNVKDIFFKKMNLNIKF